MHERITIACGKDWDGFTFRLRPQTQAMLRRRFPEADMLPQVSISYDERSGFEAIHISIYRHVMEMLTGLDAEKIEELGGARFIDSENEKKFFDTTWIP